MIDAKRIEKELSSMSDGWITLLETNAENSMDVNLSSVKVLTENNSGLLLSASRPYTNLVNLYNKNNIDTEKLIVLDCVSNMS